MCGTETAIDRAATTRAYALPRDCSEAQAIATGPAASLALIAQRSSEPERHPPVRRRRRGPSQGPSVRSLQVQDAAATAGRSRDASPSLGDGFPDQLGD